MQRDSDYIIPYIRVKGKYLATKKWLEVNGVNVQQGGNAQKGGVTTKSGLYAVFYNKNEFANNLKTAETTKKELGVGNEKKKLFGGNYKSFPSVDKIRTFMGANAFFVKEGSNMAKPVIEIGPLYKMLKFINSDAVYKIIADGVNLRKKMSLKFKNIGKQVSSTARDIGKKISSTIENIGKKPSLTIEEEKKTDLPAENVEKKKDLTANDIREKVEKSHESYNEADISPVLRFSKDKQDKSDLQRVATKINEKLLKKVNAVFIVDISRLAENEMLADIELNPIADDIELMADIEVNDINKATQKLDPTRVGAGTATLDVELDNNTAKDKQGGGFFQMTVDKELVGGADIDASKILKLFTTIINTVINVLAQEFE